MQVILMHEIYHLSVLSHLCLSVSVNLCILSVRRWEYHITINLSGMALMWIGFIWLASYGEYGNEFDTESVWNTCFCREAFVN